MSTTECYVSQKDRMIALLQGQPDDSTFDELLSELAMQRMIDRGMEDVKAGRTKSHEEVGRIIQSWQS